MKEINLDELKKIQLKILDNINDFCHENNINYWIDCGTLLGAIRHSGYIPWDDDIDIGMLRDDYNKFMELYNKSNTQYKFLALENSNDYYFPFGKVIDTNTILYEPDEKTGIKIGVYVDIFVYDNAPDDDKKCQQMFNKRILYNKLRTAQLYPNLYDHSSYKKKIMRFFLNIYLKFLPKNYYTKKMIKNSKRYINIQTKRVGNFTSEAKVVADKSIFDSFTQVTFEKKKYPAPTKYDEWLTLFYGNYMKLPPKEKQVSHHFFKAYYKGEDNEK